MVRKQKELSTSTSKWRLAGSNSFVTPSLFKFSWNNSNISAVKILFVLVKHPYDFYFPLDNSWSQLMFVVISVVFPNILFLLLLFIYVFIAQLNETGILRIYCLVRLISVECQKSFFFFFYMCILRFFESVFCFFTY